ncbi:hypothetical protein RCL_jg15358.t1 [Rhizophagus clarus]|uniref:Uncharacterized protein n=1 Tax=Rhizophagus clarus TaxID=94130 RepID=A0A8H3KSM7_9GLOM|nr:hypothetical protein RCL_jg15358.t1 [Rhizophagus clarus]
MKIAIKKNEQEIERHTKCIQNLNKVSDQITKSITKISSTLESLTANQYKVTSIKLTQQKILQAIQNLTISYDTQDRTNNHERPETDNAITYMLDYSEQNSSPGDSEFKTEKDMPNAHWVTLRGKIFNEDTSLIADTEKGSTNIVVNTQRWSLGKFF